MKLAKIWFSLFGLTEQQRKQYEIDDLNAMYEVYLNRAKNSYSDFMRSEATAGRLYREIQEKREALEDLMRDDNAVAVKDDTELYRRFPVALEKARETVTTQFEMAADGLTRCGLPFGGKLRDAFLAALMELFEKPDMLLGLRGQSEIKE